MSNFQNQYGEVIDAPIYDSIATMYGSLSPMDVRLVPMWVAAAREADEREYCHVYDNIAETVGAPSRDDLREAGYLDSDFDVEATRTVTLTVTLSATTTYTAARPGDVRRNITADDFGEVDQYDLREAISNGNYTVDDDNIEVDSVERQ